MIAMIEGVELALFPEGIELAEDQPRDEKGQFASKGGGASSDKVELPRTIKVAESGQIKLSQPKSIEESSEMLVAMNKLLDQANEAFKANPDSVDAALRLNHTLQQHRRATKMVEKLIPKK